MSYTEQQIADYFDEHLAVHGDAVFLVWGKLLDAKKKKWDIYDKLELTTDIPTSYFECARFSAADLKDPAKREHNRNLLERQLRKKLGDIKDLDSKERAILESAIGDLDKILGDAKSYAGKLKDSPIRHPSAEVRNNFVDEFKKYPEWAQKILIENKEAFYIRPAPKTPKYFGYAGAVAAGVAPMVMVTVLGKKLSALLKIEEKPKWMQKVYDFANFALSMVAGLWSATKVGSYFDSSFMPHNPGAFTMGYSSPAHKVTVTAGESQQSQEHFLRHEATHSIERNNKNKPAPELKVGSFREFLVWGDKILEGVGAFLPRLFVGIPKLIKLPFEGTKPYLKEASYYICGYLGFNEGFTAEQRTEALAVINKILGQNIFDASGLGDLTENIRNKIRDKGDALSEAIIKKFGNSPDAFQKFLDEVKKQNSGISTNNPLRSYILPDIDKRDLRDWWQNVIKPTYLDPVYMGKEMRAEMGAKFLKACAAGQSETQAMEVVRKDFPTQFPMFEKMVEQCKVQAANLSAARSS